MKYKAIIVSDLHLGTRDSKANDFIDFLDQHSTELLVLNGDIVDGWALARGSKWKKQHTNVLAKLLKLSKKTQIVWVRGNHDDFLFDFIDSGFGNIRVVESYTLELYTGTEKVRYYIFHGDVIDVFITKYKWLSKLGSIGYDIALWLNRLYNRYRKLQGLPYLSISQKLKQKVKAATNYINDFEITAIKMAKQHGCDGVICGHIHEPANTVTKEGHYLNSGDWVENRTAILINQENEIAIYKH